MAAEAKGPSSSYTGGRVAQNLQQDMLPEWFLKTVERVELTGEEIHYITTSNGRSSNGEFIKVQNISKFLLNAYVHNLGIQILIRSKQTVTLPFDNLRSRLTTSIVGESRGLRKEKILLCAYSFIDAHPQHLSLDFRTVKELKLVETETYYKVTCTREKEVIELAESRFTRFQNQEIMNLWQHNTSTSCAIQYTNGRKHKSQLSRTCFKPETITSITIKSDKNKDGPPLVVLTNLGAQIAVQSP